MVKKSLQPSENLKSPHSTLGQRDGLWSKLSPERRLVSSSEMRKRDDDDGK